MGSRLLLKYLVFYVHHVEVRKSTFDTWLLAQGIAVDYFYVV